MSVPHHTGIVLGAQGVAAKQVMLAKDPKVARAAHRRGASVDRGQFVFLLKAAAVEEDVNLAHLETANLEIDLRCKFEEFGKFVGKRRAVPCGVVGHAVECQPQHAQFGLGQVRQQTAGTSLRPSCRAAKTNPQPATTRPSRSIRIGRTKPNRSRLAASLRTCCGGCLRLSRPSGLQPATGTNWGVNE